MTWSSLVDRVMAGLPFQGSNDFNFTKVKKYLEEAQEDFAFYTKCYEKDFSFYLDAGDQYLTLPSDFVELVSTVEFKGSNLELFQRHEVIDRRKSDNTFRTGTPEYFDIQGDRMVFVPAPSVAALCTFRYVAKPTNLTDSATAYKKLRYDTLTSSAPVIGTTLNAKRWDGSAYTTAVTWSAVVSDYIDDNLEGTLIIGSQTGSINNNDLIIALDDEVEMWNSIYSNWATLLSNWGDLGLGFKALANGTPYDFPTAGDEPSIKQIYHPFLVDYAKAQMYWDVGDARAKDYMANYMMNRENTRKQFGARGIHGPARVADVL